MQNFIQQANLFGKKGQPFFFYVDFLQQKPKIFSLEEAQKAGVYFVLPSLTNQEKKAFAPKKLTLKKNPISFERYLQGFKLVQEGLKQGNSYLLNLTYPTEIKTEFSLEEFFYCTQAPFKLYVENEFVCFSPEAFVCTENNQIFTYPMKGTISAQEAQGKEKLLADKKEQREHFTIVDLMRNDLAMVGENVCVRRFRYAEKIPTLQGGIWQTSSEISADLAENWQENIGTLLAKLLPAGSISGAPKEKTLEIIQQAEVDDRGYYTGVFGAFDGKNLHSAVAIRFIEKQAGKLFFRSGGGITIHSHAEEEYAELLAKVAIPQGE